MSPVMLENERVLKGVRVPAKVLKLCAVQAWRAVDLTREECAALMNWCDHQREDLWEGMTLQEILNVYRVSAVWETFEAWAEDEGDKARRAWNRVVTPHNHLVMMGNGK